MLSSIVTVDYSELFLRERMSPPWD